MYMGLWLLVSSRLHCWMELMTYIFASTISEGCICSCRGSIPPLDNVSPDDEDVLEEEVIAKKQATEDAVDPNVAVQIRGLAKTYPGTTNIGCCKCKRTSPYHAVKVNNHSSFRYLDHAIDSKNLSLFSLSLFMLHRSVVSRTQIWYSCNYIKVLLANLNLHDLHFPKKSRG